MVCKFLPADRVSSLDTSKGRNTINKPGGNSPFFAEIDEIFTNFNETAIYGKEFGGRGALSPDERDLLTRNTADLNEFLQGAIAYINENRGAPETGYIDYNGNIVVNPPRRPNDDPLNLDNNLKTDAYTGDVGNSGGSNDNPSGNVYRVSTDTDDFFVNGSEATSPFEYFYPELYDRLTRTKPFITQTETYEFKNQYLFTDPLMSSYLNDRNRGTVLRGLNSYYNFGINYGSTSALSKFCSLVPDIFAAYDFAVDVFSDIKNLGNKIFNTLRNGISANAVQSLYNRMQDQVLGVVDSAVQKIKDQVASFKTTFISLQENVKMDALMQKIQREKDKLASLTTDDVVTYVKEKLRGTIEFATNIFEGVNTEEIEFLVQRFCQLATQIESIWSHQDGNLTDLFQRAEFTAKALKNASNVNTARARAAGAIRFDSEALATFRSQQQSTPRSYTPYSYLASSQNNPDASPELNQHVPQGKIGNITNEEIDELPTYDEILNGQSPHIGFSVVYKRNPYGPVGWNKVRPQERVMLIRLAKELGRKLEINCAYRTDQQNASTHGSATNSLHKCGQAFDLNARPTAEIVHAAKRVGFTGYGMYPNFLHIDTGAPRQWRGKGYTGPYYNL